MRVFINHNRLVAHLGELYRPVAILDLKITALSRPVTISLPAVGSSQDIKQYTSILKL